MKKLKLNKILILPFFAALLLGISRLPWHLGFISFAAFVPLLHYFEQRPDYRQLFQGALVFSITYTVAALHWITLVTAAGFVGMILLFLLYFWILFHLNSIIWKKSYALRYWGFALLWLSFEHLQNYGQFCFPWFYCGYSLADYNSLLQPAELGGISLISLYIIVTNIFIYHYARTRKRSMIIVLILMHLLWTGFSTWRYHTIKLENTQTKAGIVQVSIPQNLKWKASYRDTSLARYKAYLGDLSEDTGLAIFPESAIPGYVLRSYKYNNYIYDLTAEYNKAIFTGFPDYEYLKEQDEYLYYNTCSLFDSTRLRYPPYNKQILVPFGERIPLLSVVPIFNQIELGQANWEYGDKIRYYDYQGLKFTPQICFEVAFPAMNAKMAAEDPVFIANLTNDAWFHYSAGTYQHAMMTRFRAIETRTQYFRAANTGYSMIINPRGDILQQTELFTRETIEEDIYDYQGKSLFVKWFHIFPDIIVACAALLLLFTIIKKY